jgi:hypothetical protein
MVGGEAALAIRDFVGETFGEVPGGFNALPGREGRLPTVQALCRSWAQQRRRRMGRPPKLTIVLQPIPAQIPPISLPFPPYTTLHPPQCRPRRDY